MMMKTKKLLLNSLLVLPLLLTGCKNKKNVDFNIEFDDIVATAYVNEEYDFSEVLIIEDGVSYNLEVYYYDYYNKVEKSLDVVDSYFFTPKELFDVTVVVNAQKGNAKQSRSKTVPVAQRIDPVDELLASDGFSGWGDPGIIKEPVIDDQYFKNPNSHSALSVHFQGSNTYPWGTTFLSLNNFRLLPYWSDQNWENAVVHFWVYNPTDFDLEFQMRVFDKLTGLVNVDWGFALNVPQHAAPNSWSEINFSLKHMGVNHTLYQNEEGTRDDSIIVKVKYHDPSIDGKTIYTYQFYVDDVDVTPYSTERFPDLDTTCYATAETLSYGWENMKLDEGWSRANILYDRELKNSTVEHTSLSSMYLTFDDVELKDGEDDPGQNGYCVILSPESEHLEGGLPVLPSFRHGTLDFDVKFSDNITDKQIKIVAVQQHPNWKIIARVNVTPAAGDWMHVTFDFGEHSDFYNITDGIRLGFGFPGVNESNKATANVHIDNIFFAQNGGIPEGDIIPPPHGDQFTAGNNVTLNCDPAVALTDTIIFEIKFTSASDTFINFALLDNTWAHYFGYFQINANGTLEDSYNGISIAPVANGYYRVTIVISELDKVNHGEPGHSISDIPQIDVFFIRGEWSNATGYIDFINPDL